MVPIPPTQAKKKSVLKTRTRGYKKKCFSIKKKGIVTKVGKRGDGRIQYDIDNNGKRRTRS